MDEILIKLRTTNTPDTAHNQNNWNKEVFTYFKPPHKSTVPGRTQLTFRSKSFILPQTGKPGTNRTTFARRFFERMGSLRCPTDKLSGPVWPRFRNRHTRTFEKAQWSGFKTGRTICKSGRGAFAFLEREHSQFFDSRLPYHLSDACSCVRVFGAQIY